MHRALLRMMREAGPRVAFSHYPSRRGNLVAAFSSERGGPVWVAKVSRMPDAIASMEREHGNLRYLEQWADQLGIPRVLAWDRAGDSACLVITGAEGVPEFPRVRIDSGGGSPASLFRVPFAWVSRFQKLVPLPLPAGLEQAAAGWLDELGACPGTALTVEGLRAALRACAPDGWPAPVVVHGDFACCNVLRRAGGIEVIDWESFGPGAPFQDIFTFVCTIPCYERGRACTPLEQYRYLLFSDSPVCGYVKRHIEESGANPMELRLAFYAFLAAHLRFQTAIPAGQWRELLDYLARHGYPAPCTCLAD